MRATPQHIYIKLTVSSLVGEVKAMIVENMLLIIFLFTTKYIVAISFDEFLKSSGDDIYVNTSCNTIHGKRRQGQLNGDGLYDKVDWYLGIPYAAPPVRFEKPEPIACDNKDIQATNFSSPCEQEIVFFEDYSADCLTLNIYSPVTDEDRKLPVMVYIHGGSYAVGTGSIFLGDNLAQHGVVVVTINYRLTVFGFLTAGHPSLKGNYGMLDQITALAWVQKFIENFRGDPEKVTIFGNSAGGSSVGLLTLTPRAEGYFSQAIVQSGSPLAFWALNEFSKADLEKYVRQLASYAGCLNETMEELVECLKYKPSEDVLNAVGQMMPLSPVRTDFVPVVDGEVFEQHPSDTNKFVFDGPMMAGVVSREFDVHYQVWFQFYQTLVAGKECLNRLSNDGDNQDPIRKMSDYLFTNYFVNYTKEDVDKIYEHYDLFRNQFSIQRYSELLGDIFLILPTFEFAKMFQRITGRTTYFYEFNHNSSFSYPLNYHEVELSYIFGYKYSDLQNYQIERITNNSETDVSRYMMKLWTNFAKYGNPNGDEKPDDKTQRWEPLSDSFNCFIINDENSSVLTRHYKSNDSSFWNSMTKLRVQFRMNSSCSFEDVNPFS